MTKDRQPSSRRSPAPPRSLDRSRSKVRAGESTGRKEGSFAARARANADQTHQKKPARIRADSRQPPSASQHERGPFKGEAASREPHQRQEHPPPWPHRRKPYLEEQRPRSKDRPLRSQTNQQLPPLEGERVAKILARAGLSSRREGERLIAEGRVAKNGTPVQSPGERAIPDDILTLDGKVVPAAEPARLWLYHKPKGLLVTRTDPEGRPTLFEALPSHLRQLKAVGRLDFNSEGLLLLTNDGALSRWLERPETGWRRRYRVRIHGRPQEAELAQLTKPFTIDGIRYQPIEAELDRQQGSNSWLSLTLREGKNREIRHICTHFGWPVTRLIRIAYGPFQLGQLPEGEVRPVPKATLRDQLGDWFQKKGG